MLKLLFFVHTVTCVCVLLTLPRCGVTVAIARRTHCVLLYIISVNLQFKRAKMFGYGNISSANDMELSKVRTGPLLNLL